LRSFRFIVPVVPEKKLSPNTFVHWGQKARAKKQMKTDWCNAIAAARGDQHVWDDPIFDGPVSLKITVYWPKGRTIWDNDNVVAACKSGIDACQEKGVVINDAQIDSPIIAQKRSEGDGYVEVELTG
jgi:Holliday junction resolvase RusA-like endonuclease